MLNVTYVHTSKRIDEELNNLCRDERCMINAVHLFHPIEETEEEADEREEKLGWRADPLERIRRVNANRAAWEKHSAKALDHAIALAVSGRRVRIFDDVYQIVVNSYGAVTDRSVYRHLDKLITRGQILRVTFEKTVSGYLRPKSPLLTDPATMREQILDALQTRSEMLPGQTRKQRRIQRAHPPRLAQAHA